MTTESIPFVFVDAVCPICGSPDIELRDGAYHCFGKNGGGRFDFLWQLAVVHGRRP